MKMMLWALTFPLLCVVAHAYGNESPAPRPIRHPSVSMGKPKVYTYKRVFPLLDGRFQDRAAVTVKSLQLTPVDPNASRLDSIQTGIAASVAFNPVTGALNSTTMQIMIFPVPSPF